MKERKNTTCPTHALEYYSAVKRSEALTLTTTWLDLAYRMLSERGQTRQATQCVIPSL